MTNYDPALDAIVIGKSFYADVKEWRFETHDELSKSIEMVRAIWNKRGYK